MNVFQAEGSIMDESEMDDESTFQESTRSLSRFGSITQQMRQGYQGISKSLRKVKSGVSRTLDTSMIADGTEEETSERYTQRSPTPALPNNKNAGSPLYASSSLRNRTNFDGSITRESRHPSPASPLKRKDSHRYLPLSSSSSSTAPVSEGSPLSSAAKGILHRPNGSSLRHRLQRAASNLSLSSGVMRTVEVQDVVERRPSSPIIIGASRVPTLHLDIENRPLSLMVSVDPRFEHVQTSTPNAMGTFVVGTPPRTPAPIDHNMPPTLFFGSGSDLPSTTPPRPSELEGSGEQLDGASPGSTGDAPKSAKSSSFTEAVQHVLRRAFLMDHEPTDAGLADLAEELGLSSSEVAAWFKDTRTAVIRHSLLDANLDESGGTQSSKARQDAALVRPEGHRSEQDRVESVEPEDPFVSDSNPRNSSVLRQTNDVVVARLSPGQSQGSTRRLNAIERVRRLCIVNGKAVPKLEMRAATQSARMSFEGLETAEPGMRSESVSQVSSDISVKTQASDRRHSLETVSAQLPHGHYHCLWIPVQPFVVAEEVNDVQARINHSFLNGKLSKWEGGTTAFECHKMQDGSAQAAAQEDMTSEPKSISNCLPLRLRRSTSRSSCKVLDGKTRVHHEGDLHPKLVTPAAASAEQEDYGYDNRHGRYIKLMDVDQPVFAKVLHGVDPASVVVSLASDEQKSDLHLYLRPPPAEQSPRTEPANATSPVDAPSSETRLNGGWTHEQLDNNDDLYEISEQEQGLGPTQSSVSSSNAVKSFHIERGLEHEQALDRVASNGSVPPPPIKTEPTPAVNEPILANGTNVADVQTWVDHVKAKSKPVQLVLADNGKQMQSDDSFTQATKGKRKREVSEDVEANLKLIDQKFKRSMELRARPEAGDENASKPGAQKIEGSGKKEVRFTLRNLKAPAFDDELD